ncbi:MAG: glycosyltransferase [bacterium]|nr:glycosyltransferase [bacterium]
MKQQARAPSFCVVYITNYVGEDVERERLSTSRSAAGDKKVEGLVEAMRSRGIPVAVVSPGWKECRASGRFFPSVVQRKRGVPFLFASYLDMPVLNWLVCLWSLTDQTIKAHRSLPGAKRILIYNRDLRQVLPAIVARLLFGSRLYAELEEASEEDRETLGILKRNYFRALKALLDRFLAGAILASSTMRDRVATRNVMVCPGVFEGRDAPVLPDRLWSRLRVLYGASLDRLRGVDLLFEAMKILESRYPSEARKVTVIICGRGCLPETMRREMGHFQELKVEFLGFISNAEYEEQLRHAHVGLSLNRIKGSMSSNVFPSKVVELMAAGKIVIASAVSDVPKVAAGRALIYYKDDPAVIAKHIAEVVADFARYAVLGHRAAEWCAEHCSGQAVGRQLETLFS